MKKGQGYSKAHPTRKKSRVCKNSTFQVRLFFSTLKNLHPTRKTRVFQKVFQLSLPTLPSQHYTGMIDTVEGEPSPRASPNPEASPPSNDWRSLGGGEIYDRFIQQGVKLGAQANKVIRQLKKRGHFAEEGEQ